MQALADVRRRHLYDYVEHRLGQGKAVKTVNGDLRTFQGFLLFLQEQEYLIPRALLRIRGLKEPDRLPQHLTDEQVRLLREDFEARLARASHPYQRRDALLDLAFFHLLWQCGLRKGEVEELRLEDLDLQGKKLSVRNGKGMKDRTVFLTSATMQALSAYLAMRGQGPTDHVFLYRNQPLSKELIHRRLKAAGLRTGVRLHAHRLRHTCATQLLNAGCPVTSIQRLLGHKKLNTTMVYARAYDQTVEADYFAAMGRIEQRLELAGQSEETPEAVNESERGQLRALAEQLFAPELGYEKRIEIAAQICDLLDGSEASQVDWIPPPVPVLANAETA